MAPLAIGLAYGVAHVFLTPMTGCSVNPARSVGGLVGAWIRGNDKNLWEDIWVFICAPGVGGLWAGAFDRGQSMMGMKDHEFVEEEVFEIGVDKDTHSLVVIDKKKGRDV